MKRLLYFAYYFPPFGGAGVQRTLKFARYLPQFGWRATVVTARAPYWMQDDSLLGECGPETEVLRVSFPGARFLTAAGSGPVRSGQRIRALRGLARLLAVPDVYRGWAERARRAGERELRRGGYAALLTTSSPDSAHLIGLALRRRTGLPWVADFRDPWTRRLSYAPPSRWHDARQRRLERACVLGADRVLVTCEETRADFLERYPELEARRVVVIENGFDREDFQGAARLQGAKPDWIPRDGFDLLHAGQLNPERSVDPFFAGLRRYLDLHPEEEGRRCVWFLGGCYDSHVEAARRHRVSSSVVFAAGRPHLESVAALLSARALLLLEQDSDRGRLVLPGKLWEYACARRPILALVPRPGAAQRMVESLGAGICGDPGDAAAIADALERVWREPEPAIPEERLAPYERRALTGTLAALLDAVTGPNQSV